MDILKDMVEHIRLDFDRTLLVDEEYTSAEERLHSFIENELPPEKSHEIDSLINDVTNAMFHAAILYGIRDTPTAVQRKGSTPTFHVVVRSCCTINTPSQYPHIKAAKYNAL